MAKREGVRVRCPESVLGWIPWYAETTSEGEGVLTPRQRGAVQSHAAQCPECRAELDMIAGGPFEIDVELPDPERVFEEISERIAAEEAAEADAGPSVIPIDRARRLEDDDYRRIASWIGDEDAEAGAEPGIGAASRERGNVVAGPWVSRPWWAAAAALLLVVLGAAGGTFWSEARDVYRPAAAASADAGPRVEVVFRGDASAQEISDLLRAEGAEIVEGPSAAGVYRLRPGPAGEDASRATRAANAAALADRLRSGEAPIALFASPVMGLRPGPARAP